MKPHFNLSLIRPGSSQSGSQGPTKAWTFLVLSALSLTPSAFAQAQSGNQPDRAAIERLLKRVDELEAEVKELKKKSGSQAPAADEAEAARDQFPDLKFHGFGDATYHWSDRAGEKNTFALGQLDFFVTSRLSPNLSVLSESVVEASTESNEFGFEIERLLLSYKPSDYFNVDVGRYHTAIGYYSTAYHHGTYLQTAIGRPFFLDFEDGTGVFPIHNVGLSMNGSIPSGNLGLHYIAEVGNGRSYSDPAAGKDPVLNVTDDNDYKSFNLALYARPEGLRGLQAGVSGYYDVLTPDGVARTRQTLLSAHVVYENAGWEILNEGFILRHEPRNSGHSYYSTAFFNQLSRSYGPYRPYVRFQYLNASDHDPVMGLIHANGLRYGPAFGVRYDFSNMAALKLQYDYVLQRGARDVSELTLQASFSF